MKLPNSEAARLSHCRKRSAVNPTQRGGSFKILLFSTEQLDKQRMFRAASCRAILNLGIGALTVASLLKPMRSRRTVGISTKNSFHRWVACSATCAHGESGRTSSMSLFRIWAEKALRLPFCRLRDLTFTGLLLGLDVLLQHVISGNGLMRQLQDPFATASNSHSSEGSEHQRQSLTASCACIASFSVYATASHGNVWCPTPCPGSDAGKLWTRGHIFRSKQGRSTAEASPASPNECT